jgi:hypothetical protein
MVGIGLRRLLTVCAFVALVVAGAGVTAGAAPSESASAAWAMVPADYVSGQNFLFQSVVTPAPGDVWAIGYHWEIVGGAIEYRTLAEHYNGTHFTVVPMPDRETAPAVDMLAGASGTSATDLWAVGSSSPAGVPSQTLIEHWSGSAWSIVPSPDPGSLGDMLEGVAALSPVDAWAVGARQNASSFFQRPLALHWNGRTWSAVAVPNAPGCDGHSYLTSVASVSPTSAWAAGWCGSGGNGPIFAYIEHWDGKSWTVSAGKGTTPLGSELYGISAAGANVWAVGFSQVPGSAPPVGLSLHLVNGAWQTVVVPPQRTPSLSAVAALPDGGAWAVGSAQSPQPPFAGPFSMDFAAGSWHGLATPPPFGRLSTVALDSSGAVWAAGWLIGSPGGDRGLVLVRR